MRTEKQKLPFVRICVSGQKGEIQNISSRLRRTYIKSSLPFEWWAFIEVGTHIFRTSDNSKQISVIEQETQQPEKIFPKPKNRLRRIYLYGLVCLTSTDKMDFMWFPISPTEAPPSIIKASPCLA